MEKVKIFIDRLAKIGIEIKLGSNIPYVYLDYVNGNRVKDRHYASHGWCIGFYSDNFEFLNIADLFKIIRKYRYGENKNNF